MEKSLAIAILSVLLLTQTGFVLAAVCAPCDGNGDCKGTNEICVGDPNPGDGKKEGECQKSGEIVLCPPTVHRTIEELIESIVNWVFKIGVIVAPLMILWGAFTFVTAAGQPERIKTGKKIIFWTIVGLAIILFSRAIISIIRSILTG